jgi:hypothetical protein
MNFYDFVNYSSDFISHFLILSDIIEILLGHF